MSEISDFQAKYPLIYLKFKDVSLHRSTALKKKNFFLTYMDIKLSSAED
ncbi:hypothetical protein PLAN_150074 [Planktothrix rubescens CCAP 1459/22]|uniref:Uncharacterized protein n=1 Tax=Planktothrix rubescens CCAP 1459/22 TaxID=329571 RepID=A0A6J7ZIE0_PLARU|nr:hypothetical protein PLAN_150074 [Planktothrix rubescens NIVA-CYA 18]